MARREQVFHQFLRPLAGIGLPVDYNIPNTPSYESQIAFDKGKSKFLFSIEENDGMEDFKWVTISRAQTVARTNVDYTADADDYVVLADASNNDITITLPDAGEAKELVYNVKRISSGGNKVYIGTQNNQLIDGKDIPYVLKIKYSNMTLVSDGNEWFII